MASEVPETRLQTAIDALLAELAELVTERREAVLFNSDSIRRSTASTPPQYYGVDVKTFDDSRIQGVAHALASLCSTSRSGRR